MKSPRIIGRAIVATFVVLSIVLAIMVLHRLDIRPRTDDAVITANTITVAPEVSGRIAVLNVKDNALVHKGDILFEIDPLQYQLNLAQAKAQVSALEAEVAITQRRISSQRSGVGVAKANAA